MDAIVHASRYSISKILDSYLILSPILNGIDVNISAATTTLKVRDNVDLLLSNNVGVIDGR